MPNNVERYSIVVDGLQPSETAFIARPFNQNIEDVKGAILEAVARVRLVPSDTELNPENVNFINDIVRKIRAARIVIAVCSPERDTHKANPNVMYELGFAQSIGKSTVVLTTSEQSIPADLRGDNLLIYIPAQLSTRDFIHTLEIKMRNALARLGPNKLTDTRSYQEIWVATARHWLFLKSELWEKFVAILSWAKQVHNEFHDLDVAHVDNLYRKVEEMQTRLFQDPELTQKRTECHNAWISFTIRYDSMKGFWRSLDDNKRKVEQTLDDLQDAPGSTRRIITLNKDYCDQMNGHLDGYSRLCKEIQAHISTHSQGDSQGDLVSLLGDRNASERLWGKLRMLSMKSKQLIGAADSLIRNLVNLILEGR